MPRDSKSFQDVARKRRKSMVIEFSPFVILRWRNDQRFFNIADGGMFVLVERGLPNGTRLSIDIKVTRLLKIMEPTSLNMSSQSEDIQGNIIANVET